MKARTMSAEEASTFTAEERDNLRSWGVEVPEPAPKRAHVLKADPVRYSFKGKPVGRAPSRPKRRTLAAAFADLLKRSAFEQPRRAELADRIEVTTFDDPTPVYLTPGAAIGPNVVGSTHAAVGNRTVGVTAADRRPRHSAACPCVECRGPW